MRSLQCSILPALALTACFVTAAFGAPMIWVDLDPTLTGVQSTGSVGLGTSFEIDIAIEGVDAGSPLNAFQFDLSFDSSILLATSVVDGGFLLDPIFVLQQDVVC